MPFVITPHQTPHIRVLVDFSTEVLVGNLESTRSFAVLRQFITQATREVIAQDAVRQ